MGRPRLTDTPARDKILKAASDLFYMQGYHPTGTNQIIKEAGVSKATFYAQFPSKEALGIAYVRESSEHSLGMIREQMGRKRDAYQRYLMFYQSVSDYMVDSDFRGCNFANIAREFPGEDSKIRQEVESFERSYRGLLQETVETLFASDPDKYARLNLSAKEVADRYYLILEGGINACANYHDKWPMQVVSKAIRDMVAVDS